MTQRNTPGAQRSSRRQARQKAFQTLFGLAFADAAGRFTPAQVQRAFYELPKPEKAEKLTGKAEEFAWEIVSGVWTRRAELDDIVSRFSQNWKVARIARLDLSILRLGLYEIVHRPDIPLKVAINEAVEIAKIFGDENSPGFVNGILDAAVRAVNEGTLGQPRSAPPAQD